MPEVAGQTVRLEQLIARLQRGDVAARSELLNAAGERLMRLTRRMFHHEHRLKKLEETGDVFQNASLRLYMALAEVKPATVRDFFRLAAFHIRRELIDLARHYYGPQGLGTHETRLPPASGDTAAALADELSDTTSEPSSLAIWREFHQRVADLPDEEREMFDLVWYQGLSQTEVAALLGVSERTVQRRWQAARLNLHRVLHGEVPG
jgi:RNA polymerase sigma-70 factor (ECF subfamily)